MVRCPERASAAVGRGGQEGLLRQLQGPQPDSLLDSQIGLLLVRDWLAKRRDLPGEGHPDSRRRQSLQHNKLEKNLLLQVQEQRLMGRDDQKRHNQRLLLIDVASIFIKIE